MKKLSVGFLALATALAIAPSAYAGPISGDITIFGSKDTWTSTTAVHNPATIFFGSPNFVGDGDGDFAGLVGDAATMKNFTFATPTDPAGTVLFDIDAGAAEFVIESVGLVSDTSTFLNITGTGWLEGTGYTDTLASFTLTSGKGKVTSFTIDSGVVTPEPGSLVLLGTGLLAAGLLFRRKLANQA